MLIYQFLIECLRSSLTGSLTFALRRSRRLFVFSPTTVILYFRIMMDARALI